MNEGNEGQRRILGDSVREVTLIEEGKMRI